MSVLTEQEEAILDLTRKLWLAISELPVDHDDDIHETRRDIHNIQNRIFARPTIRKHRDERLLRGQQGVKA